MFLVTLPKCLNGGFRLDVVSTPMPALRDGVSYERQDTVLRADAARLFGLNRSSVTRLFGALGRGISHPFGIND
jgi:hypothetical protein